MPYIIFRTDKPFMFYTRIVRKPILIEIKTIKNLKTKLSWNAKIF
ncbi:hypothetical protein SAMN05421813_10852 [Daejeonella rubra]|uniref:Uncharacterized protein n=1 Tax=Daejeonella rubra TaxID=990371 RepID=A0A1G9RKM8_9SPHI|nr:hypothetical protein SAMN05421813_10852 [Daejeonella rubra]